MLTLLTLALVSTSDVWGAPVSWSEAGVARQASVSPVLVAEPAPTAERASAVRAADPSATVRFEGPRMRLWAVRNPSQLRTQVPGLVPVLHELPSGSSRLKVPLGASCAGQHVDVPGLAALEYVSAHPGCLPDFWYRPALR